MNIGLKFPLLETFYVQLKFALLSDIFRFEASKASKTVVHVVSSVDRAGEPGPLPDLLHPVLCGVPGCLVPRARLSPGRGHSPPQRVHQAVSRLHGPHREGGGVCPDDVQEVQTCVLLVLLGLSRREYITLFRRKNIYYHSLRNVSRREYKTLNTGTNIYLLRLDEL